MSSVRFALLVDARLAQWPRERMQSVLAGGLLDGLSAGVVMVEDARVRNRGLPFNPDYGE